jgi:hypothetical protein
VREIAAHRDHEEPVTADEGWRAALARPDVAVLIAERGGDARGYVSAVLRLHLGSGRTVDGLDDAYIRPGHRNGGVRRLLLEELATRHPGQTIAACRRTSAAPSASTSVSARPCETRWCTRGRRTCPLRP